MSGFFITLEGVDGAGKSTHVEWLAERLRAHGPVVATREPGGTPLGERLRELLLQPPGGNAPHVETEALLMFAARREHIAQVIEPALERGDIVLCDRYTDATFAYQGGGHGMDASRLRVLEAWTLSAGKGYPQPGLTFLFDIAPEVAAARRGARNGGAQPDRFEREGAAFQAKVRAAYLRRAHDEPDRIKIIDGAQDVEGVRRQLAGVLDMVLRP